MTIEESDVRLAERLAREAGELLLALQSRGDLSGKKLGKAGDERANELLMRELRSARSEDAILSEEETDNSERLSNKRVWIVDPLDGTREFGEGRSDWAVHVALAIDGVATVGAVALPGLDVTISSGRPPKLKALECTAKNAGQPLTPCRRSRCGCQSIGSRIVADGFCRRKGDGRGARRSRYLSAYWRAI